VTHGIKSHSPQPWIRQQRPEHGYASCFGEKTPLSFQASMCFLLLRPISRRVPERRESASVQPRRPLEPHASSKRQAPATFGNAAKRRYSKAWFARRRISTVCPCAELCFVSCQRCESAGTLSIRAPSLVHGSTSATPTISRSHYSKPRAQSSNPDFIGHPHAPYSQVCTDSRTRHQ
jgi:hypothetical protein